MRKSRRLAIKWSIVALLSLGLFGHESTLPKFFIKSQPESCCVSKGFLEHWNEVNSKLVEMAESFPSDRYHFRPNQQTRSFAEQMLHVASHNYAFAKTIKGEQDSVNLSVKDYTTKDEIVSVLKKSIAEGAKSIGEISSSKINNEYQVWSKSISHSDELYGQLVIYYHLNGLTPPTTEKATKRDFSIVSLGGASIEIGQKLLKKVEDSIPQPKIPRPSLRSLKNFFEW
jgi:hypothetical protein